MTSWAAGATATADHITAHDQRNVVQLIGGVGGRVSCKRRPTLTVTETPDHNLRTNYELWRVFDKKSNKKNSSFFSGKPK